MIDDATVYLFDYFVFFFKQKTAYEISACLVGSEMCIRDRTTRVSNPVQNIMTDLVSGTPPRLVCTGESVDYRN